MKNSGIPYLGIIPQHWAVEKFKYNLKRKTVKNHADAQVLSLYRDLGVVIKDERDDNHNVTSEDTFKYLYVRKNDFVVNKMKAWQGSVAVSNYYGIVSPAYYVYEFINDNLYPIYFHYLMRNKQYIPEFRRLSGGIREGQWDLPDEALDNIFILIPPIDEQKKIADYLDRKCAEIDGLIEDIKTQIETLEQYKRSLITEAVTKGLDSSVPMKDSGIEWVGEIPNDFQIIKIKYLGEYRNGLTYSPNHVVDEKDGVLVLRSSNIKKAKITFDDNVFVSCVINKELLVKKGDIIICSRNGSRELIGKNALIEDEITATFGAFMMIFRCAFPKYMYYILNSNIFSHYLGDFSSSTINQLTGSMFGNMKIVFCTDANKQNKIVDFLDKKSEEINNIILDKQAQIETLESYKKSLIYEYVTGKKEVV